MEPGFEELSSGKKIFRQFHADGTAAQEMHCYGNVDIALTIVFNNGIKVDETYIVKNRVVSRKRYEKARVEYGDMPEADHSLEDTGAALLKLVKQKRQQQLQAAKLRQPDPNKARQLDAFCLALMEKGQREDAIAWINSSSNTLGEHDHAKSQKIVAKLVRLGCKHIYACQVQYFEEGRGNSGHFVVELPQEPSLRIKAYREIEGLARKQGYCGDFDDGQRYAYIKLD